MRNHFVGAIPYADDIILICTTKKKSLLTGICELYAYEFSITFNAKKVYFLYLKVENVYKLMLVYVCMLMKIR